MIILDSIQSILPIIIMIAVGYVLTRKGWFNTDTSNLFSKLVTSVALPPYMIYNIMSTYTKDKLIQAGPGLIVPCFRLDVLYTSSPISMRSGKSSCMSPQEWMATYLPASWAFLNMRAMRGLIKRFHSFGP
ncbi:MAG: Auxin Efflux Carrier [Mahella sp.]|nr:Auxin Efflux Carrier [Mahella sp.]